MVTMQDVAGAAGVSAMTVSNVINGRGGAGAETRSRVLEAVAELGYEVNVAARQLRVGQADSIGVFLPTIEGAYFADLAMQLDAVGKARGVTVAVETIGSTAETELAVLRSPRLHYYGGVVVSTSRARAADVVGIDLPDALVFVGERVVRPGFDHVMMDNVGGARLATSRLLELGARRIALIGGDSTDPDPSMATSRMHGYRAALESAGVPFDDRLIVPVRDYGMEDGYRSVLRLLQDAGGFDAVLCLTDPLAIGASRALADRTLRVPEDVQVIGFDDIPEMDYFVPRLTSVRPGTEEIARTTIDTVLARMNGDERERTVVTPVRARLVERESTKRSS